MYLFDTNIFLEILLSQEKSADCKKILNNSLGNISISNFTLHSIGVILFRQKKERIFTRFVSDILSKIDIVSLSRQAYLALSEFRDENDLDFDDSYQCKIAEEKDLIVVTMDKHFERVRKKIKVKFI
ncbi:MAG: PIN domain-containing protein [Candidatus Cloacimonadota bacterium]|nr:PIN domain-containing protein [Candidatus Cloacimonadota bacterium]